VFSECRCGFVLRPRWWHLVVSCVFCLRLVPRRGHRWASNNWWWVVVKTNHSASFSSQAIRALADCHSKVSSFAANGGFSILNTEDMLQIGSSMTTLFMIAYFISFKIFFFKPFFLFVLFRFFYFFCFWFCCLTSFVRCYWNRNRGDIAMLRLNTTWRPFCARKSPSPSKEVTFLLFPSVKTAIRDWSADS